MSLVTRGMGLGPLATSGMGWMLEKIGNINFIISVRGGHWGVAVRDAMLTADVRSRGWSSLTLSGVRLIHTSPPSQDVTARDEELTACICSDGWTASVSSAAWSAASQEVAWAALVDGDGWTAYTGGCALAVTVRRPA